MEWIPINVARGETNLEEVYRWEPFADLVHELQQALVACFVVEKHHRHPYHLGVMILFNNSETFENKI